MKVLCLPVSWRIPAVPYGSEGIAAADMGACAYSRASGFPASCLSGSGGSGCAWFDGATRTADGELVVDCGATDESVRRVLGGGRPV